MKEKQERKERRKNGNQRVIKEGWKKGRMEERKEGRKGSKNE